MVVGVFDERVRPRVDRVHNVRLRAKVLDETLERGEICTYDVCAEKNGKWSRQAELRVGKDHGVRGLPTKISCFFTPGILLQPAQ